MRVIKMTRHVLLSVKLKMVCNLLCQHRAANIAEAIAAATIEPKRRLCIAMLMLVGIDTGAVQPIAIRSISGLDEVASESSDQHWQSLIPIHGCMVRLLYGRSLECLHPTMHPNQIANAQDIQSVKH